MAQLPVNAKDMPELTVLSILIQAAAAIKNRDGDTSIHGYVELQELQARRVMLDEDDEVNFAILDSIGDVLLQDNHVLAILPNKREPEEVCILVSSETIGDSEPDNLADLPIRNAKRVSSINASIVPNSDDRNMVKSNQSEDGPLGNIQEVSDGKSMWDEIKIDPLSCAVG
jgi:hypothetical protein